MKYRVIAQCEISRTNITPKAFYGYCKREVERRTGGKMHLTDWLDSFNDWEKPNQESEYHTTKHEEWGTDARTETIKVKPFDVQWYLQGSYNFIMEFQFWDEKTGFGYLYMIETEEEPEQPTEPEQPETETAEADETETNEQEKTEMKNAEFIAQVRAILNGRKCRSAWDRGVMQYAEELTAELAENMNGGYITLEQLATAEGRKAALLNGAKDWSQYSYGGSALIYDYDIAERLCNPSELKRTRNGERNPNSRETWLDCQARALSQASSKVRGIIRGVLYGLGMEVH